MIGIGLIPPREGRVSPKATGGATARAPDVMALSPHPSSLRDDTLPCGEGLVFA